MKRLVGMSMLLAAGIAIGMVTMYYERPDSTQVRTVTIKPSGVPQNKLTAYTCVPSTDPIKGAVLICTSPDYHTEYDCTSNGQTGVWLAYFC